MCTPLPSTDEESHLFHESHIMSVSEYEQLLGPQNWHYWINYIRRGIDFKTWVLVDPDKIEKPTPVPRPVTPTYKDVNPAATDSSKLTESDLTHFDILDMVYSTELDFYHRQEKNLADLRSRIAATVGSFQCLIDDEDNVAQQLSILSAHVKPTDEEYRQIATDQYYTALQERQASDVENWISNWQDKYDQAKCLDLPMTRGLCPIFQFLRAVAPIDPIFCDFWVMKIECLAYCGGVDWQNEVPDVLAISKDFREKLYSSSGKKRTTTAYDGVCYESHRSGPRPPRKDLFLKGRGNAVERTESSEDAYRSRVLRLTRELLSGLNGHRLDDYIKSWRKVIGECQRLDVYPINSGATDDFLKAVRHIYLRFTSYWQSEIRSIGRKGIDKTQRPDAIRISEIFQRCYKRKVLGPIDGIFNSASTSYDLDPPRRIRAKPLKIAGSPRSRCLCGMQHHYAACFYLVDEIRPVHWLPHTDVASRVFKQLQRSSVKDRVLSAMNHAKEHAKGKQINSGRRSR